MTPDEFALSVISGIVSGITVALVVMWLSKLKSDSQQKSKRTSYLTAIKRKLEHDKTVFETLNSALGSGEIHQDIDMTLYQSYLKSESFDIQKDKVSEDELLNAIKYLIDEKILIVN